MKIVKAVELLEQVLKDNKLYDKGWRPYINKRMYKCLGRCHWNKKRIDLSALYVIYHSQDHVLQTIYHEVAHALCKPGHHKAWKKKAVEIGATYPSRLIKTCWAYNIMLDNKFKK